MKKIMVTIAITAVIAMLSFSYVVLIADAATESGSTEISVKTNKLAYQYGEPAVITVQVKNISAMPITLDFSTSCQADFTVDELYNQELNPRVCAQMVSTLELDVGETHEWEFVYDPLTVDYPKLMPGEHEITAFLNGYDARAITTFTVGYASSGEGKFCGGIAAIACPSGLACRYDGTYPDAGGYCAGPETPGQTTMFSDVKKTHWAAPYIEELAQLQMVEGYADGTFHPDNTVTRAELVKMALSGAQIAPLAFEPVINCERHDGSYCTGKFQDLDDWQKGWVFKAQELGIVDGYDEFTFGPDREITRAEALKVLTLAFAVPEDDLISSLKVVNKNFSDIKWDADWFSGYVAYAVVNNMAAGYGDETFRPNNPITRAEASKMMAQVLP